MKRFLMLLSLLALPAQAYEVWLATVSITNASVSTAVTPSANPPARFAVQCKGGAAHVKACVGDCSATTHDTLLTDGSLFDIPTDGSIDHLAFFPDTAGTIACEVYRVKP